MWPLRQAWIIDQLFLMLISCMDISVQKAWYTHENDPQKEADMKKRDTEMQSNFFPILK